MILFCSLDKYGLSNWSFWLEWKKLLVINASVYNMLPSIWCGGTQVKEILLSEIEISKNQHT